MTEFCFSSLISPAPNTLGFLFPIYFFPLHPISPSPNKGLARHFLVIKQVVYVKDQNLRDMVRSRQCDTFNSTNAVIVLKEVTHLINNTIFFYHSCYQTRNNSSTQDFFSF